MGLRIDESYRNEEGQLHRMDGPALSVYTYDDSSGKRTLTEQHWYQNGLLSNHDGPASVIYTSAGTIDSVIYCVDGQEQGLQPFLPSRIKYLTATDMTRTVSEIWYDNANVLGLPAHVEFYRDGKIKMEEWALDSLPDDSMYTVLSYHPNGAVVCEERYENGVLDSIDDLPARVTYRDNGDIESEEWYSAGYLHRDGDKPAFIEYSPRPNSGAPYVPCTLEWYSRGRLHRRGNPAMIHFTRDGLLLEYAYMRNGFFHAWSYPARVFCRDGMWTDQYMFYGFKYTEKTRQDMTPDEVMLAECVDDYTRPVSDTPDEQTDMSMFNGFQSFYRFFPSRDPVPSMIGATLPETETETEAGTEAKSDTDTDTEATDDTTEQTLANDQTPGATEETTEETDKKKPEEALPTETTTVIPVDEIQKTAKRIDPSAAQDAKPVAVLKPVNSPDRINVLEPIPSAFPLPTEAVRQSHATEAYQRYTKQLDALIFNGKNKKLPPVIHLSEILGTK